MLPLLVLAGGLGIAAAQDIFRDTTEFIQRSEYSQAVLSIDQHLSRGRLNDLEKFNAGWLYGRAHDFQKALAVFQSVAEDVPDPVTHGFAVALAEMQMKDFAGAVAVLAPLSNDRRFAAGHLNLLGVAYSRTAQPEKASVLFERAIQSDQSDPAAYFNLTTLLCENGRFAECLLAARHTAAQFPNLSQAQLVLGAALVENGKLADSRSAFAQARTLDPHATEPVFFLALADYQARAYQSAIELLRAPRAAGVQDSDLLYLLAECLLQQGESPRAEVLAALNRAIHINPHAIAAVALRGKLNFEDRDYLAAATDLEYALKEDPQSRTAIYLLARTYQALGRGADAQALRARIKTSSEDPVTKLGAEHATSLIATGVASQ